MLSNFTDDGFEALKQAKTILLVDWPNTNVPLSLIKAGFTVYSYSPGAYSQAVLIGGKLDFKRLTGSPGSVDIVNIFRPEAEHAAIIAEHALPLNAKLVWLHPPVTSQKTAELAKSNSLVFIEGVDIAVLAGEM